MPFSLCVGGRALAGSSQKHHRSMLQLATVEFFRTQNIYAKIVCLGRVLWVRNSPQIVPAV